MTWAAQKSECPLCKAQFRRIEYDYCKKKKIWTKEERIKVPEAPEWLRRNNTQEFVYTHRKIELLF